MIFGIGIGFMKNQLGGNYQQRDYTTDNYNNVDRYENTYYDNRTYMNQLHQYNMGNNYNGTGPLYNYLQGHSQYHMMYPPNSDRRY